MKKAIKVPALKNVRQHRRHSPVVVEPPDVDVPAAFLVLELSEVLRNDDMVYNKDKDTYKVSPKNAAGAIVHRLNHQWLEPLRPKKKTKQDQAPKVMSMVKFCPTALNFGYDFVLSVHFILGHPVVMTNF